MTVVGHDVEDGDRSDPLIVVPCGRRKVWDRSPGLGACQARDVYTGPAFRQNRRYAERSAPASWIILSAKYGLISPDYVIPGPYDVTFKDPSTGPATIDVLQAQIRDQRLDRYAYVIALGSRAYRDIVTVSFQPYGTAIVAPFAGLGIGKYLQAVKQAALSGEPTPSAGHTE